MVTNIIMLMLYLDRGIIETEAEDQREYFKALRQAAPKNFLAIYGKFKLEKKYLKQWRKLLDMRYEEYLKRIRATREYFLNSKHSEMHAMAENKTFVHFESLVFGLYNHLLRGKFRKNDPLRQLLLPYLIFTLNGFIKRI